MLKIKFEVIYLAEGGLAEPSSCRPRSLSASCIFIFKPTLII